MKWQRKWGLIALGILLILMGLIPLLNIKFDTGLLVAILSIAAGILILLDR
jgi:hypothetical protein